MVASLSNVLLRRRLVPLPRLEPLAIGNDHDNLMPGYPSSHTLALDAVRGGARVLELGAGPAGRASELAKKVCATAVLDVVPPTQRAPGALTYAVGLDEDLDLLIDDDEYYLMLNVIEHLKNPEGSFEGLKARRCDGPRPLTPTTPNIALIGPRLMVVSGQFNYGQSGILDRTRTRLFTFTSVPRPMRDSGPQITFVQAVPAPIPKAIGAGTLLSTLRWLNQRLIRIRPGLLSYQICLSATATPDVAYLLASTRASVEAAAA